jgi:hypothetical protein
LFENKLFNGAFSAGFVLFPLFVFVLFPQFVFALFPLLFVAGGVGDEFPNGIKLLKDNALFFLFEFKFVDAAFATPAAAFTTVLIALDAA